MPARTRRAPIAPMEALSVDEIPKGHDWHYEPKWDGFRCIVVRHDDEIQLWSKAGKSLTRYFPELVEGLRALKSRRFVLDGEIVVPQGRALSFDALLQRIHPAESRISKLSQQTPALLIFFDILQAEGGGEIAETPFGDRRKLLEAFARKHFRNSGPFRVSPATAALALARDWLTKVGTALDGIIAKRTDLPYQAGNRLGMVKIKNYRSADCVVGGFRYGEAKAVVGSLLLGLYDDGGLLHHVGHTSSIKEAEKKKLTLKLEKIMGEPGFTGEKPGRPSRWSSVRSAEWSPLKPTLVVEVAYDHFTEGRFRHGTRLLRWRPDKAPQQCTFQQTAQRSADLMRLLNPGNHRVS